MGGERIIERKAVCGNVAGDCEAVVDVYRTVVDVYETVVDVYEVAVDVYEVAVDVYETAVDVYETAVDVYGSSVTPRPLAGHRRRDRLDKKALAPCGAGVLKKADKTREVW
jgi:hypothetical protein